MGRAVLFILAVSCFVPSFAAGAPFCIEDQGIPSECWYYDIRTCTAEADKRKAQCTANPSEISVSDKSAPYCIVDSGMVPICAFQNSESCKEEADRRGAVCFENRGLNELPVSAEQEAPTSIFAEQSPVDLFSSGTEEDSRPWEEQDPWYADITSYR